MNNNLLSLEEVQQESFKVLLKIKEIFDKNGWKYYLTYGTLIGAIRHNGFIPWDDDIDIWVPRPDYEKFIDYCIKNKEKLKPFELMHYRTNDKYIYPIARFSNSEYKIDYKNSKDYGLGLFVDIYPLDGYYKNKKIERKIDFLIKKISLGGTKEYVKSKNFFKDIFKRLYYKTFIKNINIRKEIIKIDNLAKFSGFTDNKIVGCTCWESEKYLFDKDLLDGNKDIYWNFNGEMFRIPVGYDEILKGIYKDYMELPPEEERIAHHFYTVIKK